MFILSAKLTRSKLLTFGLICSCLAVALIASVPKGDTAAAKLDDCKGETNEQRVAYLEGFGWKVTAEPTESTEVVIPKEFDETYEGYNLLQQTQGFDLSRYKGKKVMRYTYNVENYPGSTENVSATLLVYGNKVIGGDVSSSALGGFMHSLLMPSDLKAETDSLQTAGPTADEILAAIMERNGK